jgi:hypothetical protein
MLNTDMSHFVMLYYVYLLIDNIYFETLPEALTVLH